MIKRATRAISGLFALLQPGMRELDSLVPQSDTDLTEGLNPQWMERQGMGPIESAISKGMVP